jgi:4-hydroxy-tetrahydrodipicolinate synthase
MTVSDEFKDATEARRVTKLTGFLPPIATPFRDGSLDLKSLARQLDYLADHVSGYLVGGSVGEVASLDLEERATLMREAARCKPATHTLAMSISDNVIAHSRLLSEVAGECGADILMVSCPNYFGNTQAMLIEYFGAIGEFASADICIYDNPIASHTLLSVADIKMIADAVPKVTHIKVTDTAIEKVAAIREATDLVIHAGDDVVLWNQFVRGVDGAMIALPMIDPEAASSLWAAFERGAIEEAFDVYSRVAPFLHCSLGAPDFVGVIKTVLYHRGIIESAEMRLPLIDLPKPRTAEIIASLDALIAV